jgi:hypothetical protein
LKVAIYARYSSDNQREASIADQLRVCREHAACQGWTVTEEFTDHAVSGATLLRTGFQGLMRDALDGRFDVLNNELYVGRFVWNRLRYVKDPDTGKRVSRPNPAAQWTTTGVPELRIVDDELWSEVKARQAAMAGSRQTAIPRDSIAVGGQSSCSRG